MTTNKKKTAEKPRIYSLTMAAACDELKVQLRSIMTELETEVNNTSDDLTAERLNMEDGLKDLTDSMQQAEEELDSIIEELHAHIPDAGSPNKKHIEESEKGASNKPGMHSSSLVEDCDKLKNQLKLMIDELTTEASSTYGGLATGSQILENGLRELADSMQQAEEELDRITEELRIRAKEEKNQEERRRNEERREEARRKESEREAAMEEERIRTLAFLLGMYDAHKREEERKDNSSSLWGDEEKYSFNAEEETEKYDFEAEEEYDEYSFDSDDDEYSFDSDDDEYRFDEDDDGEFEDDYSSSDSKSSFDETFDEFDKWDSLDEIFSWDE